MKTFKDIEEEFDKLSLFSYPKSKNQKEHNYNMKIINGTEKETKEVIKQFLHKQLEEVFDMCAGEEKNYSNKTNFNNSDLDYRHEAMFDQGYNQKRQEIIKLKEEFNK